MPSPRNPFRSLALIALALLLAPAALAGQAREIVAQEIDVRGEQASLHLEFEDGDELTIAFDDGEISIDGDQIGTYERGDAVDLAWRRLLGEIMLLLDYGASAERLRAWEPPAGLGAADGDAARLIDEALDTALAQVVSTSDVPDGSADLEEAMAALVGEPRRLVELGRAVEDLDMERVRVVVGQDLTIPVGEVESRSVVVVDGNLDVLGEVDGSVVIVNGVVRVPEGGLITGNVRLSDGRILREGGEVEGDVENVRTDRDFVDADEIREEIRDELRRELRQEIRRGDRGPAGFVGRAARGFAELIGSLISLLVIGVLGGGLAVYFAREKLEVVADAARKAPLRAGLVGLAGVFLTLPAWILGALALIVTIVGILALPFWIVLFPIAVCVAAAGGYFAIAQSVGEWVARQRLASLDWVRVSNPYSTMVAGVGALGLWFVASNLIQMVGFLGFVSALLAVFGGMITAAAVFVGFGAVLLTRGGRRPAYADAGTYWDDPWEEDLGFGGSAPTPPPSTPTGGPAGADAPRPGGEAE